MHLVSASWIRVDPNVGVPTRMDTHHLECLISDGDGYAGSPSREVEVKKCHSTCYTKHPPEMNSQIHYESNKSTAGSGFPDIILLNCSQKFIKTFRVDWLHQLLLCSCAECKATFTTWGSRLTWNTLSGAELPVYHRLVYNQRLIGCWLRFQLSVIYWPRHLTLLSD